MRDAGVPMKAIARARGVTIKTVKRWIRRWDEEGKLSTQPRSECPRILSPADNLRLIQAVVERPYTSAIDLTLELQFPCNPETTGRLMNEAGIKCFKSCSERKINSSERGSKMYICSAIYSGYL